MIERSLAELAALVAVVEARGFSAAARRGGLRKATLTDRVRALEARLGVKLLVRTTRSVRLTAEGELFVEEARLALAHAQRAEERVGRAAASPVGRLRVSVHPSLVEEVARYVLPPLLARHERLELEIDSTTRRVDLSREGFDVALRVGELAPSELVAVRVGDRGGGYFASPGYLARKGTPVRPRALAEHALIVVRVPGLAAEWPFRKGRTRTAQKVHPRVTTDDFRTAVLLAEEGAGIVRLPSVFAERPLSRGTLVAVLEDHWPGLSPVHAVYAEGAARTPKVRVFLDALRAHWSVPAQRNAGSTGASARPAARAKRA